MPQDADPTALLRWIRAYREKVADCQTALGPFLRDLFGWFRGVRGVSWDRSAAGPEFLSKLRLMARLVCSLRGVVSVWRERWDGELTYQPPNVEQPYRAHAILFNLARGHALINGRVYLEDVDLSVVAPWLLGAHQRSGESCSSAYSTTVESSKRAGLPLSWALPSLRHEHT